jgi:hypothetical protein
MRRLLYDIENKQFNTKNDIGTPIALAKPAYPHQRWKVLGG